MIQRRLGRSGLTVSVMGLGCMEIGGRMNDDEGYLLARFPIDKQPVFFLGSVDDDESIRCIHYAMDCGVNFFDTAPAYGAGHSERIIGQALSGRRSQAIIATKFGKPIDEADNRFGRYPNARELVASIRRECEGSLQRLGTDYIDLYQYHQMDFDLLPFASDVIDILEALVLEGKIRFYGWSTEDIECARVFAQGPHCTSIQHSLNVLDDAPEMLAICEEYDQASIARGILEMGFLSGKYTAENYSDLISPDDYRRRDVIPFLAILNKLDKVKHILTSQGRTLSQGALAWIWARSERIIPVIGFRTYSQVDENIKGVELGSLSAEQMKQIEILLGRDLATGFSHVGVPIEE